MKVQFHFSKHALERWRQRDIAGNPHLRIVRAKPLSEQEWAAITHSYHGHRRPLPNGQLALADREAVFICAPEKPGRYIVVTVHEVHAFRGPTIFRSAKQRRESTTPKPVMPFVPIVRANGSKKRIESAGQPLQATNLAPNQKPESTEAQ